MALRTFNVYLNGRFVTQNITGVQRYASETIQALDGLIGEGQGPPAFRSAKVVLLTPGNAGLDLGLRHIEIRAIGPSIHDNVWDQSRLLNAARDGILVSLANRGPVLHRRHLVVIHDAIVFRHPEFYGAHYARFHRAIGRVLARTARIATVSEFSKRELADVLRIRPETIPVLPNGADHLARITPEEEILDRLDLRGRPFFFALGSISGNKNVGLAVEAFTRIANSDARLVIAGGGSAIFRPVNQHLPPGVLHAGQLSDSQIAALYAHAAAFVFPSIYEGFGIPPLEAMTFGCPVLASTAEAVRETCADAAAYFSPHDAGELAGLMAKRLNEGPCAAEKSQRQKQRAAQFSWRKSALKLMDVIQSMAR